MRSRKVTSVQRVRCINVNAAAKIDARYSGDSAIDERESSSVASRVDSPCVSSTDTDPDRDEEGDDRSVT